MTSRARRFSSALTAALAWGAKTEVQCEETVRGRCLVFPPLTLDAFARPVFGDHWGGSMEGAFHIQERTASGAARPVRTERPPALPAHLALPPRRQFHGAPFAERWVPVQQCTTRDALLIHVPTSIARLQILPPLLTCKAGTRTRWPSSRTSDTSHPSQPPLPPLLKVLLRVC